MLYPNACWTYFRVDTLLKFGSNLQRKPLSMHRLHGFGAVLRASHASLNCRQPTQDFARPVDLLMLVAMDMVASEDSDQDDEEDFGAWRARRTWDSDLKAVPWYQLE